MPWAKRISKRVPGQTSKEATVEANDYSLGYNSFLTNDKMQFKDGKANMWRLAQNARIPTFGEYETRHGFSFHSNAVGETESVTQTSTTGAANQTFSETVWLAQPFTAGASEPLTKVEVRLKNGNDGTGVVLVDIYDNNSGQPGTRLARSSIASSGITSSYAYITARFAEAPTLTSSTQYWIVCHVQAAGTNNYEWSSTTNATTAYSSSDGGTTWSSTSYALNFKQHYATAGEVKGLYRAYKSDGTKVTLLAHGTTLSQVNEVTGALTSIKTGLNSAATDYRFETANDTVYYVNGFDGYRKWDFTTESQVNSTNYTHIKQHKGLMFLVRKDDPTRVDFSGFAEYETFASTDFIYVPGPKTGDPVTAMQSLNGFLVLATLNNKFILTGDDNATFKLDEAPDQNGTYRQETMVADENFLYYLSEDGVYRSNGSEAQLLSENIYNDVRDIPNKDDCVMAINKGRLYLWYHDAATAYNDKCFVINLDFSSKADTIESLDTKAFVSRAFDGFKDNDTLYVASSRIGQAYIQEDDAADNTNLGDQLPFVLQTHYLSFGVPSSLKQIRYWLARFAAQSGNHRVNLEYAYDLRNNWQLLQQLNVQGAGTTWGGGAEWGDGSTWGAGSEVQASTYVPGEYRRIALRYTHTAARQPHNFLGHTLRAQSRRIR